MIKQLGQPHGIEKKEPPKHGLKPGGLAVDARMSSARSSPSPIATFSHPLKLNLVEMGLESTQRFHLSLCLNLSYDRPVQPV